MDKATNRRRNFAFVVFKEEGAADKAIAMQKHLLGDRYVSDFLLISTGLYFNVHLLLSAM